jgi:hypothetical protein
MEASGLVLIASGLFSIATALFSIARAMRSRKEHIHYHYNQDGGLRGE